MKKLLSLAVFATLTIMLAFGVSLAADADETYGVGSVTIASNPTTPNDVEMALVFGEQGQAPWTKEAAYLGDITFTSTSREFTQMIMLRNNREESCNPLSCEVPKPNYKMYIGDYTGDPSDGQQMVFATVTNLETQQVIYEGYLSALETTPFEVGFKYVDEQGTVVSQDFVSLQIKYEAGEEVPPNTYMEYSLHIEEAL